MSRAVRSLGAVALALSGVTGEAAAQSAAAPVAVNVHNFARAETDFYFGGMVKSSGGIGKLNHRRAPSPIDAQDVVRMNRDTLYSSGVFDLDAAPVTVTLPDAGQRFMSMQVLSQDQYTVTVAYAPGRHTFDRDRVGTRYAAILIRTLVNSEDAADVAAANRLQDAIGIAQDRSGAFEVPRWDTASQDKARDALAALGALGETTNRFGSRTEVDPIDFVIGAAIGWGGNPRSAADYQSFYPAQNDGNTVYRLTVKDVPVDGFWSISLYNAKGYFEKNDLNAYSVNNLTAKPNADGSVTVQFGGCGKDVPNCLPIMNGWNYTARLYRPRAEILSGSWTFPEAVAVR